MSSKFFPRFDRALHTAQTLAVVGVISFLTQNLAAAPTITKVVPASGATGVSPSADVVFTFSAAMNTDVTTALFEGTNATLPTTSTWSADKKTLTCTPTPAFPSPELILWIVSGQDVSGNPLGGTPFGTFTTGSGSGGGGGCPATAHTNTSFVLEESWLYAQTSANPPALMAGYPYGIITEVSLISNLNASAANLTTPNATVLHLMDFLGTGQTFIGSYSETNLADLNASWPNGSYTFNTSNASLPAVTVAFNIAQPNAPEITDFAGTQAVDSTKPFMLTWDAFSNGVDTTEIFVNIGYDPCAGTGFYTNLPATAISTTIPAGILQPGSNYLNSTLGFISTKGTTHSSPDYSAGVVRSSVTSFTLTTIGGGGSGKLSFGNPVLSGGKLTFDITAPPGKTLTIQSSTTLHPGSWSTLLTTNSGSGTVTITDTPSKSVPFRFYRAHE